MGQLEYKPNIRTCGINLNHWYVVATSREITEKPYSARLWYQNIVIYRDSAGKIIALEDRCPHRQVKLSSGAVVNDTLQCAYHGWQFNGGGECAGVPYLAENQKIPTCKIKSYPVRELDGFIWIFLGDDDYNQIEPMGLPEWDHLNYIASVAEIDCPGHYSYLIENLMDMHHGHLHDNYQAWADATLQDIETTEKRVDVLYSAQSYYRIDKIWSISQLFFPPLRRLHPEPLRVSYVYPHWASSLGQDFKIYCLFCPVDETTTKAYLIHFTSLESFWRLHKLPVWFRKLIKDSLFNTAKGLLEGLVRQDVDMIIQEQESFNRNPLQRNYEVNRALVKVQQLIISQSINSEQIRS